MRSTRLMTAADTGLLVVDVQERLIVTMKPKVQTQIVTNVGRLIDGARIVGAKVFSTEQYPRGLGPTVPDLANRLSDPLEKVTFSCCGEPELGAAMREAGVSKVCLVGMETHVCIQQTAMDLMATGFQVYVPADAVVSRRKFDWKHGIERMRQEGVVITTTESVLFEWCERAGTPQFKQMLELVK